MALWTGILDAARATDWTLAGVEGGIPSVTTKSGSTISAYTGTAATINNAITTANTAYNSDGIRRYVELGSGTFTLSSSIVMKNGVTLRGQGMATVLNFTNASGSGYYWGSGLVCICFQGNYPSRTEAAPALGSVPSSKIAWNGTGGASGVYSQGATVINLASTPTGLTTGDTLVLYQSDDTDASVPNTGYFVSSKTGASSAIAWEGSGETQATGQQQRVRVSSVNGANVTIASQGLRMPLGTWRSARSPMAGWFPVANTIHDAGLEYCLVKTTNYTSEHLAVLAVAWAVNCWIKGVGFQPRNTTWHASNAVDYAVYVVDSRNLTIRDSWIDRMIGGGLYTTTSYGIAFKSTFDSLIENNIFNAVESPLMVLTISSGNVVAYNYERYVSDDSQEGGFQAHQVGSSMNLMEGNSFNKWWSDCFHGSTALNSFFRNHAISAGFDLWSYHRWYNLIGNAMGASVYKALATDSTKYDRWSEVGFRLGYPQQNASNATTNGVAYDPVVWTSAMLWGNYIASGGPRWLSAEVPTGDATFPNSVPASQTLPNSFYRSSRPGFFTVTGIGTLPWPLIGPDVTGGNLLNGYANKTPAQRVYESQGTIASFNPSVYGSDSESSPPVGTPILSVR